MQELQDQGTVPDAVQIGNEVNTGFLWKTAQVSIDNEQNWENFTKITNSAVRAISNLELLPDQDRPKIVMHLAAGGDAVFTQKWLESRRSIRCNWTVILPHVAWKFEGFEIQSR